MGMPDYDYPNQAVQYPIQYAQQTIEVAKHQATDKWQALVLTIGETIGWGWVFGLIVAGAFVVVGVIFKRHLKRLLGDWVRVAHEFLNK